MNGDGGHPAASVDGVAGRKEVVQPFERILSCREENSRELIESVKKKEAG